MQRNVMIVEDDPDVRRTAALVLAKSGYETVQAPDGEACLAALRGGFHGVILMDAMMPGLTGWQTIRAIVDESLLEGNLICMLTAMHEPGPQGEGLEEWVFDYLS